MTSDHPSNKHRPINTHPKVCSPWIILPVCLLFLALTGEVMAASGSTRLSIHIDQSVVDAIARWNGEMAQPLATPSQSEADLMLQRLLPDALAGLQATHHPGVVANIIKGLQRDTLIVFDGHAGHAGSTVGAVVAEPAAGGRLTIHSI